MNWSNRAIAEREKVVKMTHQDIQERMEHVEMSEPHTHVVCNKSELLWSLLITALFVLFLFLSDVPDNSFISFLPQKKNTVFLLLYLPRQIVLLLKCGSFFVSQEYSYRNTYHYTIQSRGIMRTFLSGSAVICMNCEVRLSTTRISLTLSDHYKRISLTLYFWMNQQCVHTVRDFLL